MFIALDQQSYRTPSGVSCSDLAVWQHSYFETLLAIGCQLTAYGHMRSLADQNCFGSARDIVAVKLQNTNNIGDHTT
jgi:hypothetical protein